MSGRPRTIDREEAARLYFEEGLNSRQIAERLGCSGPGVVNALNSAGHKMRTPRGAPHTIDYAAPELAEMARMYEAGMSTSKIARRFGLRAYSVWYRLSRMGVAMRPSPREIARRRHEQAL